MVGPWKYHVPEGAGGYRARGIWLEGGASQAGRVDHFILVITKSPREKLKVNSTHFRSEFRSRLPLKIAEAGDRH